MKEGPEATQVNHSLKEVLKARLDNSLPHLERHPNILEQTTIPQRLQPQAIGLTIGQLERASGRVQHNRLMLKEGQAPHSFILNMVH